MKMNLDSHRDADDVINECRARNADGGETALLRERLDELAPGEHCVVLAMSAVHVVDSSGRGLLARIAMRMRMSGGDLKLCGVPRAIDHVLAVTRLKSVFDVHPSRDAAVAAFAAPAARAAGVDRMSADALCVHRSPDVLAFVRTLLKQAGYGVLTADNLSDALALLQGSAPRVVLIDSGLRNLRTTAAAVRFNDLVSALTVIDLPVAFASADPAVIGEQLVAQVAGATGGAPPPPTRA
jgi:anti-sigma B factor antagonist